MRRGAGRVKREVGGRRKSREGSRKGAA